MGLKGKLVGVGLVQVFALDELGHELLVLVGLEVVGDLFVKHFVA